MYVEEREDRRGQPVKMPSRKRGLNYSIYLDEEQLNVLDEIRWRERQSKSAIIRKAIEEYINNHAEGNDCFTLDKWQEDPNFKAVPSLMSDKERWNKYVESCNDKEITELASKVTYIKDIISFRRTQEHAEQRRQNSGIWKHYNKK